MDKVGEIVNMNGVILTPLKKIQHPKGDLYHILKKNDTGFSGFGEAYFSTIGFGEIKGWKKHLKMTLNIVVPVGKIRFVLFDNRNRLLGEGEYFSVELSAENYQRLTIPPGIWLAFEGKGRNLNLLLNMADLEHDPDEIERVSLDQILIPGE